MLNVLDCHKICISSTVYIFTKDKYIKKNNIEMYWVGANAYRLLSQYRSRRRNSIPDRFHMETLFRTCCVLLFYCYACGSWLFHAWQFYFMHLYIKYQQGWSLLRIYCVVYVCIDITTCTRSVNCLWTLPHFWWWSHTPG